MAPDPDQVDIHHHVAAHIIGKEMGAQHPVHRQHGQHHGQNRKSSNNKNVCAQRRPGKDGHFHQRHARRAVLDDRYCEVDPR